MKPARTRERVGTAHRNLGSVGLGRNRGLRILRGRFVEAQPRHVALYARTIVLFLAITLARVQFRSLLLAPKNRNGVETSMGAFLAVEHGPAVLVVVLKGFGTEGVRGTDPLGHSAGNHGLIPVGHRHLRTAYFHSCLGVYAKIVAAFTLKIKLIMRSIRCVGTC